MKAMACCSSRRFLSFFLWFWKPTPEKKKPIVMLVLSSVGFLFPCPPLCLCSQRKKETLWFLLFSVYTSVSVRAPASLFFSVLGHSLSLVFL
ncbi:hypothetical protein NC653_011707 [Populus alba x Populus x berolinensis]|uniref:Uncharacterized protein n=1 Tax=Populus alba x Populus x berolinensis TaxID=444605 RepID=A0AAD6R487_9ROSI|nr:hypothetical protein NC653_011707 [Populus alba x Populus x berolinensis]